MATATRAARAAGGGRAKTIPVARGLPLVGNLFPMTSDLRGFLTEQYQCLGPVFRIAALHHRRLVLAGPEANALMRKEGGRLFGSGDAWRGIDRSLGADHPSMVSLDGDAHATVRAGLKEGYTGTALYRQMARLVDSQRRLMGEWPRGVPFSAAPRIKRLISSLLGYMATDHAPDQVMEELVFFFKWMLEIHVLRVRPHLLRYWPRYVRSRQAVLDMVRRIWEERQGREVPRDGSNFVDTVARFRAEHPEAMTENDAVAALVGPFIAGLDTAASATSFLLYHVLKDPGLKRRVVEEADLAFAGGTPTRASLRRMDRTRRASMEVLRMYPPAPVLVRHAAVDFEFRGHRIPRGANCLVAHTVTHYLPEFFPNPHRFDIERYTPARGEHLKPNAYAPYGLGAHTCLGASTANLLFLIVTAVLFRHYDVELRPAGQTLRTVMNPLPAPDDGFRIAVSPRPVE